MALPMMKRIQTWLVMESICWRHLIQKSSPSSLHHHQLYLPHHPFQWNKVQNAKPWQINFAEHEQDNHIKIVNINAQAKVECLVKCEKICHQSKKRLTYNIKPRRQWQYEHTNLWWWISNILLSVLELVVPSLALILVFTKVLFIIWLFTPFHYHLYPI